MTDTGWCWICRRDVSRLCSQCGLHVYWCQNAKGERLIVGIHTGAVDCHG